MASKTKRTKKKRCSLQKSDSIPKTKLQAAAGRKRKLITKPEEIGPQSTQASHTMKLRSSKRLPACESMITDESTQSIQREPIVNTARSKKIRKEESMQGISDKDEPTISTSSARKEEESGQDLKNGIRKCKAGKISTDAVAIEQGTAVRSFIPHDIIIDILSRLPVKSLVRFRGICKVWFSLTYDAYFVGEQQKKARDRFPQILSGIIAGKEMTLFSFNVGGGIEESSFEIGGWSSIWVHRLSNSVNGLAFAYGIYDDIQKTARNFYLLNPSTQEYSALPMSRQDDFVNENFGFGFDSSSGTYKVVRIFSHEDEGMRCSCEILTLGSAEWKCIGEILLRAFDTPVFINEHLYWLALTPPDGNGNYKTILSFDVKHEKFGFKSPPDSKNCLYTHIMELESHLCFVAMRCRVLEPEPEIRIWKLIDGSIWVKFYHIKLDHWAFPSSARTIVGTVGKMLMLVAWDDMLLCCDLQKGTMHQILEDANPRLLIHKESLVSPRNLLCDLDA